MQLHIAIKCFDDVWLALPDIGLQKLKGALHRDRVAGLQRRIVVAETHAEMLAVLIRREDQPLAARDEQQAQARDAHQFPEGSKLAEGSKPGSGSSSSVPART